MSRHSFERKVLHRSASPAELRTGELWNKSIEEGLLPCGKASAFFRSLGVGEARATLHMYNATKKSKVKDQWWAPQDLVRLNRVLEEQGVSSKIRARTIRNMLEGRDLPEKAYSAVAVYTESCLLRSSK